MFKFASSKCRTSHSVCWQGNGLGVDDLDLFVPHQANLRIRQATAERMDLPLERIMVNIENYANTTAATVPIALSEAADQGRLSPGHFVQLTAVGGGLTWGSVLLRWTL